MTGDEFYYAAHLMVNWIQLIILALIWENTRK